mgnify:CR=1 FL=1|jgi:hypothetical protein
MVGIPLKGLHFECTSCGHPIKTFSLGPGEVLNCPECEDRQVVPEMASEVHKPGSPQELPRPTARAIQAPARRRYPLLVFFSTLLRLFSVTVLVVGLIVGILSLAQGGVRAAGIGGAAFFSAVVVCVLMLVTAESLLWMVDVEEHLRVLRGKDS